MPETFRPSSSKCLYRNTFLCRTSHRHFLRFCSSRRLWDSSNITNHTLTNKQAILLKKRFMAAWHVKGLHEEHRTHLHSFLQKASKRLGRRNKWRYGSRDAAGVLVSEPATSSNMIRWRYRKKDSSIYVVDISTNVIQLQAFVWWPWGTLRWSRYRTPKYFARRELISDVVRPVFPSTMCIIKIVQSITNVYSGPKATHRIQQDPGHKFRLSSKTDTPHHGSGRPPSKLSKRLTKRTGEALGHT